MMYHVLIHGVYVITGLDDWDIIAPVDVPRYKMSSLLEKNILGTLTGTLSSGMGKTLTHMQRAMGECTP